MGAQRHGTIQHCISVLAQNSVKWSKAERADTRSAVLQNRPGTTTCSRPTSAILSRRATTESVESDSPRPAALWQIIVRTLSGRSLDSDISTWKETTSGTRQCLLSNTNNMQHCAPEFLQTSQTPQQHEASKVTATYFSCKGKHNLLADPNSLCPLWQMSGTQPNNKLHCALENLCNSDYLQKNTLTPNRECLR